VTEESFGRRLRRERERRQIALSSISANTKISVTFLAALERDDVSRWPSGIFRRAFIRSYADAIGLDPDDIMREFLERFPDPADPPPVAAPASPASRLAPRPVPLRLTLADGGTPFAASRVLANMRRRWSAVAFDVSVVVAIAAGVFAAMGEFWTPLAIAAVTYYATGILLLGNSPGVCLWAPTKRRSDPHPMHARIPAELAASIVALLGRFARTDWTREMWRMFRTHG
jgi:transcriptional regulator with XRE-family HTH domain